MFKIVIPSYNRVDKLKNTTLKLLERENIDKKIIYIFVANEEEYIKYKKEFTDYNIIKGVIGLLAQIKFIENYFDKDDYLVRIEDDIENIFKNSHMGNAVVAVQGLNIYRPVTTNIINIINSTERLKGTLFTRGVTGV